MVDFLHLLEGFELFKSKRIDHYRQALTDQVFWESRKFYRETMQKFVSGELNALEFVQEFSDQLLADSEEANNLVKDF